MTKVFLFFILFKILICGIIKIPFGIINTENDIETYPLISKLLYNKIYINFTIGTPPKKIKIFLRKDNYALYINEANFNQNYSSSLELTSHLKSFFLDIYTTGYFAKDKMKFENYNINNSLKLDFILSVSDDNKLGGFGLKIPLNASDGIPSFLVTLKDNSIISSLTWTLKYYYSKKPLIESINDENNPIGEFIIGGEPHEYEENKWLYPQSQYNFLPASVHSRKFYWDLKFKSIYTISEKMEKIEIVNNNYWKDEVSLKSEYSLIWGPEVYKDIIYKIFFNKYGYKDNICFEKSIPKATHLHYIECDNVEDFDLKKYPTIYFESFEFNKTFELTYEDLFVFDEKTNKYIYLIVFPINYVETSWSLGIPFIRKYQFTFNEDRKVIGFYNTDNYYIEEKQKKKSKIWLYILVIFLFVVFCGLLILLGMFLHKMIYGEKRKKKANELDDDYEYETKENVESINSDKIINDDENKKERLVNEKKIIDFFYSLIK